MDFQRWYDMDVNLGELVRCLESMSPESRTLFGFLLSAFSDRIVETKGRDFYSGIGWDTIRGIYQSHQKRRWYDEEPAMQQAFNKLYSLSEEERAAVGRELHVPARLVSQYELYCLGHGQKPKLEWISDIVDTCFEKGPEVAQQRFRMSVDEVRGDA